MKFIWAGCREQKNTRLCFTLTLTKPCDALTLCAVDFYRVFLDGKFVCYGPERTASGYARKKTVCLENATTLRIEVEAYNVPCYCCDYQLPFFGAEIKKGGSIAYTSTDFLCQKEGWFVSDAPRFNGQRGFVEVCDFHNTTAQTLTPYEVDAPKLLEGVNVCCRYPVYPFSRLREDAFEGFSHVAIPDFEKRTGREYAVSKNGFHVLRDFVEATRAGGYRALDFRLEKEKTGFLRLDINAKSDVTLFAVFEEHFIDGEWHFRRSECNDIFVVKLPKGKRAVQSFEPYALTYLKIVYKGEAEIIPSLVGLENGEADGVCLQGNPDFERVFEAARNTFVQNAVDIFTDCPGRERAGWLCDSYFTGMAEALFTGSNKIERAFLENIILADTPEIPAGITPKCFPSEHSNGVYIPNWAMWFVLELCAYAKRTGDTALLALARDKVFGIVKFFDKYVNEYGLLENLEGWVFIEWSVCNSPEYLQGVNFPSNILFADMLEKIDEAYGVPNLKTRAREMKKRILELSFDGEYFADNAVRSEGKLLRCDNHVSETCQYYALFFQLKPNETYAQNIIKKFGPLRPNDYLPQIGRSNMFIGNYLRFFWLCEEREYERVTDEMLAYFSKMAQETGTLWEHDKPQASCNHGFASVAAVLLSRCATKNE